jgi:peptide deformylase
VLGETEQMQLEGFVARIFQHECDHLQGKVFLDRVDATVDIIAESEYFKLFN